ERDDVLVYTSPVLQQDLKVAGPVTVHLWATTDGRDTDWTAKLVDVYPDGKSVNLCDGIIRARYRQGTDKAVLLNPGQPYDYTVDLVATANLFKAGHRVRVEISSSNFPRFDRNSNSGGKIQDEATGRAAMQRVHHTAARPSSIELPVLP
ncbi:MAG: CocE/NonD family hydrolase, partial [SAR202 cluster bacterium]|nr:CocE/NonD family hydrolase [SAR202 cluster bacterium]